MNCIFCNYPLAYYRDSFRFNDGFEYKCNYCTVSGVRDPLNNSEFSRCLVHVNRKKEILFQDISIESINMEHNFINETTQIGEWKKIKGNIELEVYITIPLSLYLNDLTVKELRKKLNLYLTFS